MNHYSQTGWKKRIGGWIREYWSRGAVVAGAVLFSSVGLILSPQVEGWRWLLTSWPGRIFVLGVVLTLFGNAATWRREKRLAGLQQEVTELEEQVAALEDRVETRTRDYYAQFRTELAMVLKEELGYGDTERISVYRHRGRTFQLLGRYSENPQFDRRTTRLYPDHQGVVAKAWEDRTAAELSLPDPEGDEASYYQTLEEKWSMDEETTRQLTMRSRALVGCAIYEPKGVDREAVVIVESARVGTITREEVVRAMEGEAGSRIYEFLEREESNEPDPNYAKEQDY
jgi:hypothetical protein